MKKMAFPIVVLILFAIGVLSVAIFFSAADHKATEQKITSTTSKPASPSSHTDLDVILQKSSVDASQTELYEINDYNLAVANIAKSMGLRVAGQITISDDHGFDSNLEDLTAHEVILHEEITKSVSIQEKLLGLIASKVDRTMLDKLLGGMPSSFPINLSESRPEAVEISAYLGYRQEPMGEAMGAFNKSYQDWWKNYHKEAIPSNYSLAAIPAKDMRLFIKSKHADQLRATQTGKG